MDIFLKITGTARTDSEDTTETITRGTFYRKDETVYLFYSGADEETPELITKHRITVREGRVEIQRTGLLQSLMILAPEERHPCDYVSPLGVIRLDFRCTSMAIRESSEQFLVQLDYEILVEDTVVSVNHLEMEATPVEENASFLIPDEIIPEETEEPLNV